MKRILVCIIVCTAMSAYGASPTEDTQALLYKWAPTLSTAAVPIVAYIPIPEGNQPATVRTIGSAFFINRKGFFVTVAHVIDAKPPNGFLCANVMTPSKSLSCMQFIVVEKDSDHDLALCQIPGFITNSAGAKTSSVRRINNPFASLDITHKEPKLGELLVLAGAPVYSTLISIQLGIVSALNTVYPPGVVSHNGPVKDTLSLLQVTVSANHGDSGGPLIDLTSGAVVGVLDQLIPSPLFLNGKDELSEKGFERSGIFLVIPAKWVNDLLTKNHAKSEAIRLGQITSY